MNNDTDDLKDPKSWKWWTLSVVICLVIWAVGGFLTNRFAASYFEVGLEDNAPALFGDSFGAVNALISAIAFAGMLVTFRLQKYELSLQRKELAAQRNEFNQQNATLKLQRFENTFFNMLELQQQIVNGLTAKYNPSTIHRMGNVQNPPESKEYHGREVFAGVYRGSHIHQGITSLLMKSGMKGYNDTEAVLIFDHYFRNLYTILRFIDESKVFDEESLREEGESVHDAKYKYATILRASLSGYELVMLYYNGLSDVGKSKLKPLLEKYCMLNNLNKYLLTMSLETRTEIGVSDKVKDMRKTFQDNDYSGTDYELLLTSDAGDEKKYHYTAFAHTEKEKSDFMRLLSERQQKLEQIKSSLKYKSDEEQKYERVIGGFSMK